MKAPRAAWTVAHYRGAPIGLHLSIALGLLFYSFGRWEPGAWVGFTLVVLLHELGHAMLVSRYGLRVVAIDLHGFGGECSYSGEVTPWRRSVIAWGGVLAPAATRLGENAVGQDDCALPGSDRARAARRPRLSQDPDFYQQCPGQLMLGAHRWRETVL